MTEEVKITGTLEEWCYHPYYRGSLAGHIYGDSKDRFVDGTLIYTSVVQKIEGDLAYTMNSVYKLGKKAVPHTPEI